LKAPVPEKTAPPAFWLAADIICTTDQADDLCALLHEHGSQGAEVRDDRIVVYFPADADSSPDHLALRIGNLLRNAGYRRPRIAIHDIQPEPWVEQAHQFFKPVRVSPRILVLPDWETSIPDTPDIILRIRPGQGFGTGHHESTRIFLRMIEATLQPGNTFLDVGCGSGIATIAALRLGASHCLPVDIDPLAVTETRHNLRLNNLAGAAKPQCRDMRQHRPRPVDVVGANMLKHEIESCWDILLQAVRPGGILLLSGLLLTQCPPLLQQLRTDGFRLITKRRRGEWGGLAVQHIAD
jgi:ribosomal protein L11 methyltransferase